MNRHPRIQHQGHHLFVRTTLWKTYIVCEECGVEYGTAWNKLYERLGYRVHGLLGFIFFGFSSWLAVCPQLTPGGSVSFML